MGSQNGRVVEDYDVTTTTMSHTLVQFSVPLRIVLRNSRILFQKQILYHRQRINSPASRNLALSHYRLLYDLLPLGSSSLLLSSAIRGSPKKRDSSPLRRQNLYWLDSIVGNGRIVRPIVSTLVDDTPRHSSRPDDQDVENLLWMNQSFGDTSRENSVKRSVVDSRFFPVVVHGWLARPLWLSYTGLGANDHIATCGQSSSSHEGIKTECHDEDEEG